MSNKDQPPNKSGFSLQDEIKKRKTQEMQRTIEQKKIDEARGGSSATDPRRASQTIPAPQPPPAADPRRASQTIPAQPSNADPRRATQTNSAVPDPKRATQTSNAPLILESRRVTQTMRPAVNPGRASQPIPAYSSSKRVQRTRLIAVGAGTLAILVLVGSFLIASNLNTNAVQPTATATLAPLPTVSASDILSYLQKAGVPISNLRKLPVDPKVWSADEEIEFDIQRGSSKGTFIVLSYATYSRAVGDSFQSQKKANLKDWQVSNLSNVVLLTSPDTTPDITAELASHLTSYLLVPYRPYLPTPTQLPTTAAGTEAATSKA